MKSNSEDPHNNEGICSLRLAIKKEFAGVKDPTVEQCDR